MRADPLLLTAGEWLGIAGGGLLVLTLVAFLAGWGFRFRLVGVTSFTVLLSLSCLAFAVSYAPRVSIEGAVSVPVVFDNGSDLVVAAAPADLPASSYEPTVEQVARNLRGSGRKGPVTEVRLRRVEAQGGGTDRPVVLAKAQRTWADGSVVVSRSGSR